jgi:hypothetical protein
MARAPRGAEPSRAALRRARRKIAQRVYACAETAVRNGVCSALGTRHEESVVAAESEVK